MDFDVTLQDTEYATAALFAEVDQAAVNLSYTGEVVPATTDDVELATSTMSVTSLHPATSTADSTSVVAATAGTATSGTSGAVVAKALSWMVLALLLTFCLLLVF